MNRSYRRAKILASKFQAYIMLRNPKLSEFARTTRQKVPCMFMGSEKVRDKRAIDLKAKKAEHLGNLIRKRLKFVQKLISEHASEEVI